MIEYYTLTQYDDKCGIRELSKKEILEKKFLSVKYEDKYIMKCLQKDILDFQEYTKDIIKRNKVILDDLIKLVQTTVSECIPDYEVNIILLRSNYMAPMLLTYVSHPLT
jgi:hypothetical protein